MGMFKRLRRSRETTPFCAALVPAAGSASRMAGRDKVMEELAGAPVLARTLRALEDCPLIQEIVVVTRSDLIVPVGDLCKGFGISKATHVVVGGASRTESVRLGLQAVSSRAELVAIHDGARPLVPQQVLDEAIRQAAATGAAAPAVPVKDTVKVAVHGQVRETPDRSCLYAVQTPQVFEASLIRGALQKAAEEGWELTDDCSAVERLGMKVTLTQGAEENLKLTTPIDFAIAEGILLWRAQN